nr:MAG TPA: hypothetical protein [Caudoviricetes sp.]
MKISLENIFRCTRFCGCMIHGCFGLLQQVRIDSSWLLL